MYKWFKWCMSDLRSVSALVNARGYPCAKGCNSSASQWLSGEQVRLCSGHPKVHFGTIVEGSWGGYTVGPLGSLTKLVTNVKVIYTYRNQRLVTLKIMTSYQLIHNKMNEQRAKAKSSGFQNNVMSLHMTHISECRLAVRSATRRVDLKIYLSKSYPNETTFTLF